MTDNPSRKAKGIDLAEFSNFPNKLIVKPQPLALLEHLSRRHKTEPLGHSAELKQTQKGIGTRWSLDSIPNLKGIPNGRMFSRPRHKISREESFDEDFMMPSRVREVLRSEGLEHNVINSAIGNSEAKHEAALRKMAEERVQIYPWDKVRQGQPPGLNMAEGSYEPRAVGPSSWLPFGEGQLETMYREVRAQENTVKWPLYKHLKLEVEDFQLGTDKRKWLKDPGEEQLFFGKKIKCPRIVLISSKIKKCRMLLNICQEDVLPIIYDFDKWTFADIIENINKKLMAYRKYSKARSLMLYCQGGPGYIYLLRNYAITPQKLQKPSYRGVVEFWKSLGCLLSKLRPAEAVIHLAGFKLLDDPQGHKLLPVLQGIMYPNLVRVEVPDEEKEAGRNILGQYFQFMKYKLWRTNQNVSSSYDSDEDDGGDDDDDCDKQDNATASKKYGEVKKLTLSIR